MKKHTTALARVVAFTALVAAFLVVIVVISTSLGGSDSTTTRSSHDSLKHHPAKVHVPATYTIQNGDTLTEIAHKMGISVVRIEMLNPSVDPQILVSGQKLKLR